MTNSAKKREVGRPEMPDGYGLGPVKGDDDLISWAAVEEKLRDARNYWVSSTRPDGRPHAMPVWGIWMEGAFFFSTDPQSRKGRNLATNPEVVVHLESGDDVAILEGRIAVESDAQVLERVDQVYYAKYRFHTMGEEAAEGLVYRLKPRVAMAWLESSFPTSATRWKLRELRNTLLEIAVKELPQSLGGQVRSAS